MAAHAARPSRPDQATAVGSAGRARSATRMVVATFGVLAALAGAEHGVGEIRQGSVPPPGPVIESWPDVAAFAILGGEPALTVVPDLLVSGILTVVVAGVLGAWAAAYAHRRHGGLVLILLALLLLVVGGGFGPPLIAILLGIAATRIGRPGRRAPGAAARAFAAARYWLLGAGVVGYLGLLPGTVLLHQLAGVDDGRLVIGLTALAFAGLLLALVAARAHDRAQADRDRRHRPAE